MLQFVGEKRAEEKGEVRKVGKSYERVLLFPHMYDTFIQKEITIQEEFISMPSCTQVQVCPYILYYHIINT